MFLTFEHHLSTLPPKTIQNNERKRAQKLWIKEGYRNRRTIMRRSSFLENPAWCCRPCSEATDIHIRDVGREEEVYLELMLNLDHSRTCHLIVLMDWKWWGKTGDVCLRFVLSPLVPPVYTGAVLDCGCHFILSLDWHGAATVGERCGEQRDKDWDNIEHIVNSCGDSPLMWAYIHAKVIQLSPMMKPTLVSQKILIKSD